MMVRETAIVAGLAVYFLPAVVAGLRRHRKALAIFALDLLLGWTLVGWIAALVWALKSADPADPARIVVNFGMSEAPAEAPVVTPPPPPARATKAFLILGAVALTMVLAVLADRQWAQSKAGAASRPTVAPAPPTPPVPDKAPVPAVVSPAASPPPAPSASPPAQPPAPAPAELAPASPNPPAPAASRRRGPDHARTARKPYDPSTDPLPDANGRY